MKGYIGKDILHFIIVYTNGGVGTMQRSGRGRGSIHLVRNLL